MPPDLTIEPPADAWQRLIDATPNWRLGDHSASAWRASTRDELGLATDRPIVATGHQPLLWHPGILSKYLIADRFARATGAATANLIVDQHVGDFASLDVPILRDPGDGSEVLDQWQIEFIAPLADVPMSRHGARRVTSMPTLPHGTRLALPWLDEALCRIVQAMNDSADAPNAAVQMARSLERLMQPWVELMPMVCGTGLLRTGLARAILERMAAEPEVCVRIYNDAVAARPAAGLTPLTIARNNIELPLWRIDDQNRRQRAALDDLRAFLEGRPIDLMPRALLMTAILRLGVCDLFIHGTGGAAYDGVMEQWVSAWLGLYPSPFATVTATLRLPFGIGGDAESIRRDAHRHTARSHRVNHDPSAASAVVSHPDERLDADHMPTDEKQRWLRAIDAAPRKSRQRRERFFEMHKRLAALRETCRDSLAAVHAAADRARRRVDEIPIRRRRDWAFALYPNTDIGALAQEAERAVPSDSRKSEGGNSHDEPCAAPAASCGNVF